MLQLPQRTPQLPLVTFENLCWNYKHVVSNLGLKIGVAKWIVSQLGVVTLEPRSHVSSKWKKHTCGSGKVSIIT
jgi:hypothetical protein